MPIPGFSGRREATLLAARRLEELLRQRGSLSAEEACRLLLRAGTIRVALARSVLEGLVAADRRFLLDREGSIRLAPPPGWFRAPLKRLRFTVVDLETTGGSPETDRILEVGAIRVEEGSLREGFGALINPGVPIPRLITSMTGIHPAMVEAAPAFPEVAEEFARFIGDSVLVAHNLPFDLGFLNRELGRAFGFVLTNPSLCTVRLGRRLLPDLPDRRLDTLADHYGFSFARRHRALGDA